MPENEVLESLKECAAVLDQLLNGQNTPSADDVDAALSRANAAIKAEEKA